MRTISLSFTNVSIMDGTDDFVGLQNFQTILQDAKFHSALPFTLLYVIGSGILGLVFGLLIALLLNLNFRGRGFTRTINLIPWAIPPIVAAYAFRWLLDDQFGMIPHLVHVLTGQRILLLISPTSARITLFLVNTWKLAPFIAVIFLAGLQGISDDLYEAAKVEGANAWQHFWKITLPLIFPLVITLGMFQLIWLISNLDLVYGLTEGGPGIATLTLALYIFRQGIPYFRFGYASALSVILLILVGIIGLIGRRLSQQSDVAL